MKGIMDKQNREAILGDPNPTSADEAFQKKEAVKLDKDCGFSVCFACVSHFYTDLPNVDVYIHWFLSSVW